MRAALTDGAWESVKPGDIFRVFEDGGRNIITLFPETGVPNVVGLMQRLEDGYGPLPTGATRETLVGELARLRALMREDDRRVRWVRQIAPDVVVAFDSAMALPAAGDGVI